MAVANFSPTHVGLFSLALIICTIIWNKIWSLREERHMPPGPPGIPILGNALQLPSTLYWQKFREWKEQYGNIFSLSLLGQRVVVISDFVTTADLLSRRSVIYSDRPRLIMANELMCGNRNPAFVPYGNFWRRIRKAGHEAFNARAVTAYRPLQEEYSARLISALLKDPEHFDSHICRVAAGSVLSIIYGWPPLDSSMDPIVDDINGWVHKLAKEAMPGARLVELFPWMVYIPAALAPWKKWALGQEAEDGKMFQRYLAEMQESKEGTTWAANVLKDRERLGLGYEDIAWLLGGFFGAGSETSSASLRVFLLAMLLHPEAMRRAQQEIDSVIGRSRMPTFDDEPSLPYVSALVKELLRWRPVVPMGLPRKTTQDDWYNGYLIPKDTVIIQNVWGMNHDHAVFDNPEAFLPERYLEDDGSLKAPIPDTVGLGHASFGAGRRICCGKELALQSLFINIANILWALDIEPAKGANGNPIVPSSTALIDNGVVVEPPHFECILKPRSADLIALVDQTFHNISMSRA